MKYHNLSQLKLLTGSVVELAQAMESSPKDDNFKLVITRSEAVVDDIGKLFDKDAAMNARVISMDLSSYILSDKLFTRVLQTFPALQFLKVCRGGNDYDLSNESLNLLRRFDGFTTHPRLSLSLVLERGRSPLLIAKLSRLPLKDLTLSSPFAITGNELQQLCSSLAFSVTIDTVEISKSMLKALRFAKNSLHTKVIQIHGVASPDGTLLTAEAWKSVVERAASAGVTLLLPPELRLHDEVTQVSGASIAPAAITPALSLKRKASSSLSNSDTEETSESETIAYNNAPDDDAQYTRNTIDNHFLKVKRRHLNS